MMGVSQGDDAIRGMLLAAGLAMPLWIALVSGGLLLWRFA